MFNNYDSHIGELPLSVPFFREKLRLFLLENGLRTEEFDSYYAVESEEGEILAGAGLRADVIKCVAVREDMRSEGLLLPLLSHLVSAAASRGITNLKVFTRPSNRDIFQSIGFKLLASAPKAILMENGRGLQDYVEYLKGLRRQGRTGVIVMNANPFTKGHRFLVEEAASRVDNLVVIPVLEDTPGGFPYGERLAMIKAGVPGGVIVADGSSYQISALTFPTYFLKDLSEASETQMLLDIDLCKRHIAPALGADVRFVGSEPSDALTARYNALMREQLSVVEIPRQGDRPVSASAVRKAIGEGKYAEASAMVPGSTRPYVKAALAERALLMELNTPMKPGLVGPDSSGAHKDMDYDTMRLGIHALRPFWSRMVVAESPEELRSIGLEAEKAMLEATGGVNTHRGAIFCLGLALYDHLHMGETAASMGKTPKPGATDMALGGYSALFADWLPYFRLHGPQRTLLRIISSLEDSCVIKRAGRERAREVKREAEELLGNFSEEKLETMCRQYAAEGISPGGAADMLALTIFIDSLTD